MPIFTGNILNMLILEMPTLGCGPRHPPGSGTHLVTGDVGWELNIQNPGGRGFFLKILWVFGGLFIGMMCGSK